MVRWLFFVLGHFQEPNLLFCGFVSAGVHVALSSNGKSTGTVRFPQEPFPANVSDNNYGPTMNERAQ